MMLLEPLRGATDMPLMSNLFIVAATALMLVSAGFHAHAQGIAPGGPIGGSTGIGSGLGGINGTGPSWPNGSNQAPQPSIPSVPPGGYSHPAPSFASPPSSSPYPQPGEPFAATAYRPPAQIPLTLPEPSAGSLAFLRGCWRSDVFTHAEHPGSTTWCFDDKGSGRFLYTRVDRTDFYCHAQAQARLGSGELHLRSVKTSCDDGSAAAAAPAGLTCRYGTDGALCSADASGSPTIRLYRVR
jgi:hypothetical protein